MIRNTLITAAFLGALVALRPLPSLAVTVFAHRYGVSCQACHSVVPRLNAFGESFRAAGFRWPTASKIHATLPVTIKANLAYSAASDPTGLPKAIVDEVEFLAMGPI